jgi:hypothetical protein
MTRVDLLVALLGVLIAVGSIILGAWLDLRPERRHDEPGKDARRHR